MTLPIRNVPTRWPLIISFPADSKLYNRQFGSSSGARCARRSEAQWARCSMALELNGLVALELHGLVALELDGLVAVELDGLAAVELDDPLHAPRIIGINVSTLIN